MTIKLYGSPPAWQLASISPFCTKLELYFRIAGIEYTRRPFDPMKAPKGKMPYIDDGNGLMGDSQLIIERFESKAASPIDAWLSAQAHAQGHLVRRMLEEASYFGGLWSRWGDDAAWPTFSAGFAKVLPGPVKLLLPLIRRRQVAKVEQQGTGRHSKSEIYAMLMRDFDAVSEVLGDKPFLLGDAPSTYDCTLFAFLDAQLGFPVANDANRHLRTKANLVAYHGRIRDKWFSELPR